MGLVHAHGDDDAGECSEAGNHPDRRADPERVGQEAGEERAVLRDVVRRDADRLAARELDQRGKCAR